MNAPAEPTTAPPARWLLPSLTQWLWLLIFLVLLAQPWRTKMTLSDADVFMHWRFGDWMLDHHTVLRQELFSHTRFSVPSVSKEWLSEIIYAGAGRVAGLGGMVVVAALVIATTFALLHRQLLREGNDVLTATLATLFAAWVASLHWMTRPHVFSLLIVVLWHAALRRHERDGQARRLYLVLGGLAAVWCNLHGGFVAGFFLIGAYWLGAICQRDWRKARTLTIAGLLALGMTLLNPNGWQLHLHNIQFLRSSFMMGLVAEFRSPDFHGGDAAQFAICLAILFVTTAVLRPKLPAGEVVALLSWLYFGLHSSRYFALLAIIMAPILAPAWADAIRRRWPALAGRVTAINAGCRGWPVVAVAALVAVLVPRPVELSLKEWPVEAVQFVQAQPARFTGNLFNSYVWGSYLLHALPEHRVFVDSRSDFYGEPLLRDYQAASRLATNWAAVFARYDVRWTLLPTDHRLNQALALVPEWECAFSNGTAMVFRKTQ